MSLLKWIGPPGSLAFLALCCAIGLACRRAGWVRFGRRWLLSVYAFYVLAGLPFVANAVASRLPAHPPIEDLSAIRFADGIIVLHGDNVRGRVGETKRVLDATNAPLVLGSGGGDFREALVAGGIPEDRLVMYPYAPNTFTQIAHVRRFVRERNLKHPVLIASRLQMPRIAALVRSQQLEVILAPSPVDDEPPVSGIRLFIPIYGALRVTRDATYELAAVRYYKRSGLIR